MLSIHMRACMAGLVSVEASTKHPAVRQALASIALLPADPAAATFLACSSLQMLGSCVHAQADGRPPADLDFLIITSPTRSPQNTVCAACSKGKECTHPCRLLDQRMNNALAASASRACDPFLATPTHILQSSF